MQCELKNVAPKIECTHGGGKWQNTKTGPSIKKGKAKKPHEPRNESPGGHKTHTNEESPPVNK